MIGWRARFGVILPSLNATTESEFYRCLPEGVTAHFTRMGLYDTTPEQYESMIDDVPAGVEMLSHAKVNALMFGCTSGSLYGGIGYDQMLLSKIGEVSDTPASTTSTAVINAFSHFGVKKVAVVTPYLDWVNDLEKQFFEKSGVEVLNIQGLGMRGFEVNEVHPEALFSFAKAQDRPDADALFMSCMGLRTLEVLPQLEKALGKPVISSNQATLWELFNMSGISCSDIRCDFGSLFSADAQTSRAVANTERSAPVSIPLGAERKRLSA